MTWLNPASDARATLDDLLRLRPDLVTRYRAFYRSFWDEGLVPRRILELCRLRIAAIHDCDAEWEIRDAQVDLSTVELSDLHNGDFGRFGDGERVALSIAEKMPLQHHQISDADVEALKAALGAAGAVATLTAIAFFDVSSRLRLAWDVPTTPVALGDAPLDDGKLP